MVGSNILVKGSVLVYRIFDVAQEINLDQAEKLLTAGPISRFKLSKNPYNAIIFKEPPLCLTLGKETLKCQNKEFKLDVYAKLWDYGVISICLQVNLPEKFSFKELVDLGAYLEESPEIYKLASSNTKHLTNQLNSALKTPYVWSTFEDYSTYVIEEVEEVVTEGADVKSKIIAEVGDAIKRIPIPRLIMAESKAKLADSFKQEFTKNYLQYSNKDAVIIDWNSAVIFDLTKDKYYSDYADMIELALTQLLEFRYYDELLDKRLSELMDQVQEIQNLEKVDSVRIKKILVDARKLYVDFAEVFERIDNSLKMVGDQFYATIFRAAGKKLRFNEWKESTSTKMDRLIKITDLLENEVSARKDDINTRKSHLYEIIIILLIAKDSVPAIWKFLVSSYSWVVNFLNN